MARVIELITSLDPDVLLFHRMDARETLSGLGAFELDLLSKHGDLDPDRVLAQNVTIRLELPEDKARHFNGYVTRFAQAGMHGRHHLYRATVRPWLWFLTRTSDCRIFQDLSVPDILRQVFDTHPQLADVDFRLTGTYSARTCCTQYRESDFDFVSRLMEEEGIYYFFRHAKGRHTLVLADSHAAHEPFEGYARVAFVAADRLTRPEAESISRWDFAREIQPGAYALGDFDFEKPAVDLRVRTSAQRGHDLSDYEVFDYPGRYRDAENGEQYARTRLEALQARAQRAQATTNARGIAVGCLFELTGQPRADQNREHLVLSAAWRLEYGGYESADTAGADYQCTFEALDSRHPFRPGRTSRKPVVQGPQTAIVVGPAGEEIYTDRFGRVKVQFHWDRYGRRNENSSCWMRVSHPWAGKGWGSVSIPRIGQEVIVDFLEGDPDQPIITGRVYNAESMPPYGLPAGGVVSGLKSSTHKGRGYNEMSMDDTAGKEKITVHGQYDMNTTVEHDQTTTVHNSRTDKVDVDDSETVGNNQTQKVGVNQTITVGANRTESVGGAETITITGHRTETVNGGETVTVNGARSHTVNGVQTTTVSIAEVHSVGAGRMHNVGAGEAISVGGAQAVNVGAVQTVSVGGAQMVSVGALQSVNVAGPHKLTAAVVSVTSKGPIKIKAAAITMIEAPTIVLKAGGSKIVMNASGITIKAAKVGIKADAGASLKAGGNVTLDGGGGVKVKGPTIGEN